MTLVVVKKTEEEFRDWLATEPGFLMGLGSFDGEPIKLEGYQLRFLEDRSPFRWVNKSRQIGFSFIFALESVARCHLRPKQTSIFVSYNLEDAKEKILIARQIHEELPLAYQKRLIVDSKTELAFENNGPTKRVSRILSNPSKAPRGKHGDIYLDELAHYINDQEVYKGSTALILRSDGQLTGASTPLGARGVFYDVFHNQARFPNISRHNFPWWLCTKFCRNVRESAKLAPHMTTAERVKAFGNAKLQMQFEQLLLEDFQQEYECLFVDETMSFYPYELINTCLDDALVVSRDITTMRHLPTGRFVAGFDVGRTKDRSELAVFEENCGRFWCRMLVSFENVPFAAQEAELRRLLNAYPIHRLRIDRGGIGMNMAENLSRDYTNVEEVQFTNESKERMAQDFKILMQQQNVILPNDRDLKGQIHSIQRKVLPSGAVSYDSKRSAETKGHADGFWACALACKRDRGESAPTGECTVGAMILG